MLTKFQQELRSAVLRNDENRVKELILSADFKSTKNYNNELDCQSKDSTDTLLMLASRAGNVGIIECLLLNKANPNIPNNNGQTPLMIAAEDNNKNLVDLLLANGANALLKDKNNENVLDYAASGSLELVDYLYTINSNLFSDIQLFCGADNSLVSSYTDLENGKSALIIAAENDRDKLVHVLANNGADLYEVVNNKNTFVYAVLNNSIKTIKRLKEFDSDTLKSAYDHTDLKPDDLVFTDKDSNDYNIYDIAKIFIAKNINPYMLDVKNIKDTINQLPEQKPSKLKLLINNADNLMAGKKRGKPIRNQFQAIKELLRTLQLTPLMKKSKSGDLESVKNLIGLGANYKTIDGFGMNAFAYAVINNHLPVVQFLYNIDKSLINYASSSGANVLIGSLSTKNYDLVKFLLDKGADPLTKFEDKTVLDFVRRDKHPKLYELVQTRYNSALKEKETMEEKNKFEELADPLKIAIHEDELGLGSSFVLEPRKPELLTLDSSNGEGEDKLKILKFSKDSTKDDWELVASHDKTNKNESTIKEDKKNPEKSWFSSLLGY